MCPLAASDPAEAHRRSAETPSSDEATPEPVTSAEDKEAGSQREGDSSAPASEHVGPWGVALGVLFWAGVGLVAALSNDTSNRFLRNNWMWLAGVALALMAAGVVAVLRGWLERRTASTKATLFISVLPVIGLILVGIFALPEKWQLVALRSVFLAVVILTPAVLWWLFIAAQRASLLNEFLTNLYRLGLLEHTQTGPRRESSAARATRINAYLKKFEASYGTLKDSVHKDVLENRLGQYAQAETTTEAPLLTAIVPVSLATVAMFVGWLLLLPPTDITPSGTKPRWLDALEPNTTPVTLAFLGAYFFSLQMLFRRYVRKDLRGSAYIAVLLRVVLAAIGIWVIAAVGEGLGAGLEQSSWQLLLLGFVIGVFPRVAWQLIRGMFTKTFHRAVPSLESRLPLDCLDGCTIWHEARFEEEDIENVPNMATADIVELLANTPFPGDRLIDWVDQAILLTQLGAGDCRRLPSGDDSVRGRLAAHGIRTASALLFVAEQAQAAGTFDDLSEAIAGESARTILPSLISAVQTNGNLALVLTWRGLSTPRQLPQPRAPIEALGEPSAAVAVNPAT